MKDHNAAERFIYATLHWKITRRTKTGHWVELSKMTDHKGNFGAHRATSNLNTASMMALPVSLEGRRTPKTSAQT
ncbi:hypothetical protein KIN20_010641 [Parelaphostrongylus tenuis]|uniref:Uncharacterized protein n=1 Tax=Parelaphostrongylus tenuis TaxID=148309 RepID=A0AAD5MBT8_PARTN|nr:hypothetical protein KIN20_010641 [Parelaphostrongylus tenuis]